MDYGAPLSARGPGEVHFPFGPGGHGRPNTRELAPLVTRPGTSSSADAAGGFVRKPGELPRLKRGAGDGGTDTEYWSLKRDAAIHRSRWSTIRRGLLLIADELLRLGEEQKAAWDKEMWCPDVRLRAIHNELHRHAAALFDTGPQAVAPETERPAIYSARPGTREKRSLPPVSDKRFHAVSNVGGELEDVVDGLPDAQITEENSRLRRELSDRDGKARAFESAFLQFVTEKGKHKVRETWLQQYGLTGRLLMQNTALALQICSAWSNCVAEAKSSRVEGDVRVRVKASCCRVRGAVVEYMYARSNVESVSFCLAMWVAAVGRERSQKALDTANARCLAARQRLAPTFGQWCSKKEGSGNQALSGEVFDFWHAAARQARLSKEVAKASALAQADEANVNALVQAAKDEATAEKVRLLKRFGEAALGQLRKMIAADESSCLQLTVGAWMQALVEVRRQKEFEAAKKRMKDGKRQAMELAFAGADGVLLQQYCAAWKRQHDLDLEEKKRKDHAIKQGLRAIAGGDSAIQSVVYQTWFRLTMDERGHRMDGLAKEREKALAAAAKESRLAAAQIGFGNMDRAALAQALGDWRGVIVTKGNRSKNVAHAMRIIANSSELLLRQCWTAWAEKAQKEKARNASKAKAMEQGLSKLKVLAEGLMLQILFLWTRSTDEVKRERIKLQTEEDAKVAKLKARTEKLKAMEMMTKNSDEGQALLISCFGSMQTVWKTRKRKLLAAAHGARTIEAAEIGLKEFMFSTWRLDVRSEITTRQMTSSQTLATQTVAARKRALAMYEKALDAADVTLIYETFYGLHGGIKHAIKQRKRKDVVMARALRGVSNSKEAVVTTIFRTWANATHDDKELVQERGRRRRKAEKANEVILYLQDKLKKRVAWDAWLMRASM